MAVVMVVDDERSMREMLQVLLEEEGHEVHTAPTVRAAQDLARQLSPSLIVTDLKLPGESGLELLKWAREALCDTQVIIITAFATAETAIEAMRIGAYDYQTKPFQIEEMRVLVRKALEKAELLRANRELSLQLQNRFGLSRLFGRSPRMSEVIALMEKVAPTNANVLIEGESGTGKELVARALHENSRRARGPFVPVNCGAIPENLIEAELFGHAAGAFTGATRARQGLFESAHQGSLLLDKIGDLPASMQVKLLRVLQERTVRRVGDDREHSVDVRILASTNRDLEALVTAGKFREDLFYRLNVVRIRVPALRDRREDVPVLARAFLVKYAQETGKDVRDVSDEVLALLGTLEFPGNVRELENYVQRAVTLASGSTLTLSDLPPELLPKYAASAVAIVVPEQGLDLEKSIEDIERAFIRDALHKTGGNRTQAAKLLGLSFRSLRYRLAKLGFTEEDS